MIILIKTQSTDSYNPDHSNYHRIAISNLLYDAYSVMTQIYNASFSITDLHRQGC